MSESCTGTSTDDRRAVAPPGAAEAGQTPPECTCGEPPLRQAKEAVALVASILSLSAPAEEPAQSALSTRVQAVASAYDHAARCRADGRVAFEPFFAGLITDLGDLADLRVVFARSAGASRTLRLEEAIALSLLIVHALASVGSDEHGGRPSVRVTTTLRRAELEIELAVAAAAGVSWQSVAGAVDDVVDAVVDQLGASLRLTTSDDEAFLIITI